MLELKQVSKSFGAKSHRSARLDDRRRQYLSGGRSFRWWENHLASDTGWFRNDRFWKLLLDGKAFDPTDTKEQEQVVGVVFQDFQLFPHLSVLKTSLWRQNGAKTRQGRVYSKSRTVGRKTRVK